jgi:soluble lytic murein transglycosylase-like protein/cell wall-associated NlpC family hydrolase
MRNTHKIRAAAVAAAATLALAIPIGTAQADDVASATPGTALAEPAATPVPTPTPTPAPASTPAASPAPLQQGTTLAPPAPSSPAKSAPASSGGVSAGEGSGEEAEAGETEEAATENSAGALTIPGPSAAFAIPSLPASACSTSGVPPVLIPIYQRAAAAYGLGPQGPAVLAGINEIETAFGTNLNVSSAGAVGWMQFMPATWDGYGVDANGDGVADPFNPEDAIYAAASYLSANGMPADTYGAIFAYNHADWYVSEVLANAACHAAEVGVPALGAEAGPQLQVLKCSPAPPWRQRIPHEYMRAFEDAAARYELGKRGVWALAAVAHLESDFGRGMSKKQLRSAGPLGLEAGEWAAYGVDGDGDGRIRHGDPVDSAATLARLIWSRGSLSAGIFTHNQAEWYVQEVMLQADEIGGSCKARDVDWALAPLGGLETAGPSAVLDGTLASAPREAPPAIKAAIAAANSITTTPYVWGGGHGSFYSYGYDCSGAVSFALYGAGLLGTPLTSGSLESYGEPGPGKWITIYANATHAYMTIAGLRFDTAGNAPGVSGPRWHVEPPYPEGFVVRHPVGY